MSAIGSLTNPTTIFIIVILSVLVNSIHFSVLLVPLSTSTTSACSSYSTQCYQSHLLRTLLPLLPQEGPKATFANYPLVASSEPQYFPQNILSLIRYQIAYCPTSLGCSLKSLIVRSHIGFILTLLVPSHSPLSVSTFLSDKRFLNLFSIKLY